MKLTIALEQRFFRTPDGVYWTDSLYPRSFWSRYLVVFDAVKILARVHEALAVADRWKRVDGEGISVAAIPAYIGPWEFACKVRQVHAAIASAVADDSAMLLRVPGLIAMLASSIIQRGRPYGVEVASDPYDVFSPGASSHPLRPLFRWCFSRALKAQCREAACNLYVTQQTLQRRYPPGMQCARYLPEQYRENLAVGVSDVDLPDEAFLAEDALWQPNPARINASRSGRFRIVFVGTLEVGYKAVDVLITAVARCVRAGLDAELTIIGNGRQTPVFQSLAGSLGVSDRVTFLGALPAGEPVRQQIDASDLFVLPSRVEGLPRALLEAMARGLACIATRVGGVPELLPEHAMVTPGDANELAAKILELAANPTHRAELGAHNLATARRYHQDLLQPRRVAFYRTLRDLTVAWRTQTGNDRLASAARPLPGDPWWGPRFR